MGSRQLPAEATLTFDSYGASAPENYERYFVPAIAAPLAEDLVDAARIAAGDRVLDVATGTGAVARLASERLGPGGRVTGIDLNPGMIAVARAAAAGDDIAWHEACADALPFADATYDVVFCQLGVQFFPDRLAALAEMRRVLATGGRVLLNVPGPMPRIFLGLADAVAEHVGDTGAGFVRQVFSLHDPGELEGLLRTAGLDRVSAHRATKTLHLPPAREFLWQYVYSTPLAASVGDLDAERRAALEHDVLAGWHCWPSDPLTLELGVVTASGVRPG